ncbi:MAG: hypothetical protein O3B27_00615 [Actinomycetota bacterium]|nr:hypothetical protein [Actinomycetota bacterium]
MTIRFTASRLLMAAICGGALLSAPMVTAPPAHAACNAGQIADPVTGICWSQSSTNLGISGTGGTCLPGRLGLCLGALQSSQLPGARLKPQAPAGANRVWP